jgi:hypothetical protein
MPLGGQRSGAGGRGVATPWMRAIGLAVATYLVLLLVRIPPPQHNDTADHFLAARRCVELGICPSRGQGVSLQGYTHFALFSRVLRLLIRLGLTVEQIQLVLWALLSTASGLMYLLARTILDESGAILAAPTFTVLCLVLTDYPIIFNRALLPIGLVAFAASYLQMIRSGSTTWAVLCGGAIWLVVEGYLECVVLAPIAFGAAILASRQPIAAATGVVAGCVSLLLLNSFDAVIMNGQALIQHGLLAAALAGAALTVGASALRSRYQQLPASRREDIAWRWPVMIIFLVVAVAHVLRGATRADSLGYLTPIIPMLAVATVRTGRRAAGRWLGLDAARATTHVLAPLVVGVGLLWLGGQKLLNRLVVYPNMIDIERLAHDVYGRGYSSDELSSELRGRNVLEITAGLRALAPFDQPVRATPGDVPAVLTVPDSLHAAVPPDWRVVSASDGHRVLSYVLPWWVARTPLSACIRSGDPECRPIAEPYPDVAGRPLAALVAGVGLSGDAPRLEFALPVQTTADEERIIACSGRWLITGLDGVPFRGTLPARSVTIPRGPAARGVLHLQLFESPSFRPGGRVGPPDIWEVRPSEAAFAAPFPFPFGEHD